MTDRNHKQYCYLVNNEVPDIPKDVTGFIPTPVGIEEAKEEKKQPNIHGEINTFVSTMTGSPKISKSQFWTPEKALYLTSMHVSTLQDPLNQN